MNGKSLFSSLNPIYRKRPYRRTNLHLRDIINTTRAEVEYPTESDVAHELSLKRIYSVHDSYNYTLAERHETI